jgi:hypothetical protein
VLLVDAMKAWDVTDGILTNFFSCLGENAYVIHQDFGNSFTPWIHLVSYRLRECLVPVVDIARSETVVFKLVKPVEYSPGGLRAERESFDDREVSHAFEHSLWITRAEKHSGIHAARAMLSVYDGDMDRAETYIRQTESAGVLHEHHAAAIRVAIKEFEDE